MRPQLPPWEAFETLKTSVGAAGLEQGPAPAVREGAFMNQKAKAASTSKSPERVMLSVEYTPGNIYDLGETDKLVADDLARKLPLITLHQVPVPKA